MTLFRGPSGEYFDNLGKHILAIFSSQSQRELRVEDAESTVDYARSAIEGGDTEEGFARLRAEVSREIAEKGHFFIKKDAGIFVARGYANA